MQDTLKRHFNSKYEAPPTTRNRHIFSRFCKYFAISYLLCHPQSLSYPFLVVYEPNASFHANPKPNMGFETKTLGRKAPRPPQVEQPEPDKASPRPNSQSPSPPGPLCSTQAHSGFLFVPPNGVGSQCFQSDTRTQCAFV
jgi:hypothetical protein